MSSDHRDRTVIGISTITFRNRDLPEALRLIKGIGAEQTELGAIPGVAGHVPVPFDGAVEPYLELLARYGLKSGAVNADVGDLNDPALTQDRLSEIAGPLIRLAAVTGGALIVPGGRADRAPFVDEINDLGTLAANLEFLGGLCGRKGIRLLVEAVHHRRYIHSVERAGRLLEMAGPEIFGILLDTAHVGASGDDPVAWVAEVFDRIERVHLRDAAPGDPGVGIGRGTVNLPGVIHALESRGYRGDYILELDTHDVAEEDREADARRSLDLVASYLRSVN